MPSLNIKEGSKERKQCHGTQWRDLGRNLVPSIRIPLSVSTNLGRALQKSREVRRGTSDVPTGAGGIRKKRQDSTIHTHSNASVTWPFSLNVKDNMKRRRKCIGKLWNDKNGCFDMIIQTRSPTVFTCAELLKNRAGMNRQKQCTSRHCRDARGCWGLTIRSPSTASLT